ncbi:hypothetical protein DMB42_42680 [Nonomuraea sp. WAC 01424]|uniref:hypothetical protein n=1 Tax=Nonomuraea sp. WAC 01424 TaxID=2203200 RepID=UPI000F784810|nr:hypothetical protein [Nonomuraea sp. WAC 01424]RSM99599.1 hypothetical protein DMB42_42680 [Nonomuraea sp. WAC 01424]
MNRALGEAFHRLGQEARDYADADRALAALRTRRTRRTRRALVAGSAALVVIAGGLAAFQARSPAAPDATVTVVSPAHAVEPPAQAPTLPATGPVGRGALVYTACQSQCPTFLLLADGRQYLLGERTVSPPGNITLSPDGRWLGQPVKGGYEVRDLLGDAVHRLEPPAAPDADSAYSPWAWSADSRRLIVGYHASGDVRTYRTLELPSGRTGELDPPPGQEPVGLLPSGEPLLLDHGQDAKSPLERVTLKHADTGRAVTLASGTGVLADADHGLSVQTNGERVFVLEYAGDRITVLEFDVTGRQVARLPLPPGQYPVGPVDGGYAVIQVPQDQARGRQKLEVVSPVGRRPLFDVPGPAAVVLPGGARH